MSVLCVYSSLLCLAERCEELYCFSYKPNVDEAERRQEWDFLDPKADYSRMGLPNSLWKFSPINQHYKVSEPTSTTQSGCFSFLIWRRRELKPRALLLPSKGERHVPRRPVRASVRHAARHRGELQVQEQRPISYSVVLLQGKSREFHTRARLNTTDALKEATEIDQ